MVFAGKATVSLLADYRGGSGPTMRFAMVRSLPQVAIASGGQSLACFPFMLSICYCVVTTVIDVNLLRYFLPMITDTRPTIGLRLGAEVLR